MPTRSEIIRFRNFRYEFCIGRWRELFTSSELFISSEQKHNPHHRSIFWSNKSFCHRMFCSRHSIVIASKRVIRPATNCFLRTQSSVTKTTTVTKSVESGTKGSNFLWTFWEKYTAALMARPLAVKASTASVIFFLSDSGTQYLMDPTADYDVARAGSGAAFGVVATGWLHYWWGFLEAFVGKRLPIAQRRLSNTLVKVFLDQAIGAPIYIYTYYVITNYIQELNALPSDSEQTPTKLLEETCERAAEMLPPTMLRHWTLWPLVHSLNFYYSPLHHRVLVQNLVLVGWSGCKCLYRRASETFFLDPVTSPVLCFLF